MSATMQRASTANPWLLSAGFTPSFRVFERNVRSYRRNWMIFLAACIEPVFYLLGLGVGLGALISDLTVDGRVVDYATFVTPGLIAASAMNGAVFESTFNFFYKLRYAKTFDAMLATPLRLGDIVIGEINWAMFRGGFYALVFTIIAAALGTIVSWWAVLCVPAALLVGLAFCSAGIAVTSYLKSWSDFEYVMLVVQTLFLASTTFFPLSVYPEWSRPLVQVTPLYHGVALCRDLALGTPQLADLGHVAYLVTLAVAGALVARRRLGALLLT